MTLKLHHSGLAAFRRCRRKWDLFSRQGWRANQESNKLWFGSAFHAGMRAFHLTNPPDSKAIMPAIEEYFKARVKEWGETPLELEEYRDLLKRMFLYYVRHWLPKREPYDTLFTSSGEPMCEVDFAVDLPGGFRFEGTFDRVARAPDGRVFVLEYKTAKSFNTEKLSKDEQVTSYLWAASKVLADYGDVAGVLYQQHVKTAPTPPEPLKRGGLTQSKTKLSTCSASVYEAAIKRACLDPNEYVEILMWLRELETEEGDNFVRRDIVTRTPEELSSFEERLIAQAPEYFNPRLPIYPNLTQDCAWDCDFAVVCDAMNSRGDPDSILAALFHKETKNESE